MAGVFSPQEPHDMDWWDTSPPRSADSRSFFVREFSSPSPESRGAACRQSHRRHRQQPATARSPPSSPAPFFAPHAHAEIPLCQGYLLQRRLMLLHAATTYDGSTASVARALPPDDDALPDRRRPPSPSPPCCLVHACAVGVGRCRPSLPESVDTLGPFLLGKAAAQR